MDISKNPYAKNCHSEAVPSGDFLRGAGRGICFLCSPKNRFFVTLALLLACLAAPATAAAEELGRLFFTPEQRQDLDRRRATDRTEVEAPPQIREGPLTLDGHVQRSGGKTATWINGVPQYDSHGGRDPARVTVVPNADEPGVSLKVGQIYERMSGEVRDDLHGGKITVGKPSAKVEPAARRGAAAKSPAPAR